MKDIAPKAQRCAIYTRKSTEHNLDLAFNSLDAQREACEAYIKSQAHEGWGLLPNPYDDGGMSGASMDRPALQKLLTDVRTGNIDIVVVYKVDRLTRSLADFAKLVEAFDAQNVSFVSITQSFNTTSSMGRLTLNVLLSFAQFEREVIGERVRDKIAASKRKGIWVGGPVPLGYRVVDKKLIVIPEEADVVRTIFARYLEAGSIRLLSQDLAERGICPRPRAGPDGTTIQFARFLVGPLGHILKNRCYVGEVAYRGEVHRGEQEPIVDRDLFEAVQTKLGAAAVRRRVPGRPSCAPPSLLTGLLFDDRGNRMTPSHANKKGVRYRYYVCQALLQNRKPDAGAITRVSAPDLEQRVLTAVRHHVDADRAQPDQVTDRDLVAAHVVRVMLWPKAIAITVRSATRLRDLGQAPSQGAPTLTSAPANPAQSGAGAAENVLLIPWTGPAVGSRPGILSEPSTARSPASRPRDDLLLAIAKARGWLNDIVAGRVASFGEIARREGKVERHIRLLAPLAFVAPAVIAAIAEGRLPADVTVTSLARALPHSWAGQEHRFGLA